MLNWASSADGKKVKIMATNAATWILNSERLFIGRVWKSMEGVGGIEKGANQTQKSKSLFHQENDMLRKGVM